MAEDDLEQTQTEAPVEAPVAPEVESVDAQPLAALPGPSITDMMPVDHDEVPKPVANPFDRFDKMPAVGVHAPKTGNPFDAFDAPKDRAMQAGLDTLPEFSLLKEAFRSRALTQSLDDAVSKDALASEARRSLAQVDPTGQKAWLDWEIGDAKADEDKWQGELRQIREAGAEDAPAELPRIMDALEQAQQRLTLARTMRDDLDRGVERAHSMPYQMALSRSIGEQEKRVAYQNDVLRQALEDPSADPIAISNAKANVQFEQGKLDKLRSHQEKGQQRVPVQGATGTGEWTRAGITGVFGVGPEMLGGFVVAKGQQDIGGGFGDAMASLGEIIRDFGRDVRRDTQAPAVGSYRDLDWNKKEFFNDLKLYLASLSGQAFGTSAFVLSTAAVGGTPAAAGTAFAMGQGQMQNALEEALQEQGIQLTPEQMRPYVWLYGSGIGLLDLWGEMYALSGLKNISKTLATATVVAVKGGAAKTASDTAQDVAAKSFARSLARGIANGAAIEGVTEGLQEILEIHGVSQATGKAIDWDEARRRIVDSVVGGAVGGAGFGAMHARRAAPNQARSERPELVPQTVPSPAASEPVLQPVQPQVEAAPPPAEATTEATPAEPAALPKQLADVKAYLDEGGTLAKSDMPALAERLGVTEQELPKLLDEAVTAGTLRKTAGGMYRRSANQPVAPRTPEAAQAAIDEAIASMKDILPKGTKVQAFGSTAELPEGIRAPAQKAEAQGNAVDAVHSRTTGDIYLHQFAVDPAAKLGHEGVHALVTRNLMTPQEIKLLAERAAKIPGIFDRATYEQAYQGRKNLPALLDEEAAAHLIEARIKGNDFGKQINGILDRIVQFFERLRNALSGKGFQTADDVAKAFFSGEMAAREPVPPGFRETPWGDSPPIEIVAKNGKGFTLFPLTDAVKAKVQSEGQPMFALRDRLGLSRQAPELQSMNALVRDLGADLGIVVRRGFKTTASKVAKAAATRAGELLPAYYDPTTGVLRLQRFNDITAFAEAAGKILAARYGKIIQKAVDKANTGFQIDLEDLARWRHQLPLLENNLHAMRTEASQIAAQGFMKDSAETQARGRRLERDIPIRERELEVARRRVADLAARTQNAPVVPDDMSAYFTSYLSNPDGVRTDPFTDVFEAAIDAADPALMGKIEGAQNAIAAYAKANPVEVMRSIIVPSTKQDAWDRFKSDAQRFGFRMALGLRLSDFYANVWANDHPFYLATRDMLRIHAEQTGTKLDLKALENPAKLWRSAAQARSRATRDLDKGIRLADAIDHSGPSFTDALTTALGPSYADATDTGPGSRYRDFGAYLLARMGVERWERYERAKAAGELGQLREPYSTPKSVMRQAVVELETKFPTFAAAAEMLYKFQNNLLTLQWQKGLITDETYQALQAEKNYVPSLRSFEDEQQLSGSSGKKGETALADVIKRFRGSQRDVVDPLASIALKVFKTRSDIAVNDTLKRYLYLAEQVGPGGGLFAERLDPRQAQAFQVSIKDALRTAAKEANLSENDRAALVDMAAEMLGGNVTTTMFTQGILRGGKGEPIVYIREKGNVVPIRLGKMGEGGNASARLGQQIWELLNTFGETHTNWVLQMMALPAQAVRGAVVSHPSFMLANVIRDAPAAFGYDPRAIPLWTQFKGMVDIARGAEYVERYRSTGGMMGGEATQLFDQFMVDHDMETFVRKGYKFRTLPTFRDGVAFLQDAFSTRNWGDKAFGATIGGIAGFGIAGPAGMGVGAAIGGTVGGKTLAAIGELSETATRAQLWKFAYERAKASNLSDVEAAAEAAFWAHDYGDYSRHGLKTDVFRRWVPFLNANLQANDSFFRRLLAKGDYGFEATKYVPGYVLLWPLYKTGALQLPSKLTARQREELAMSAWAWFETMAVIGSASLVYALVYRDDDRIKLLPESLRANHWNIPLDDLARAIGLDLPKEHRGKHFARIPKPFERAIVANTIERLAMEYAKNNPRWFEHWLSDVYEVTKPPLMPTMFDLPAQLLMNRDSFSGREIVPRQGAGQRMRSEQFDEYSSQFARWLGEKMNLSPMQIDFMISKLGSTWGRDATRANIPGAPWYDPKAPAQGLDEKFIASRFLYKVGKGTEAEKAMKEVMGGEDPIPKVFEAINQPYSRLDANAESYKFYKNRLHQDAKAFAKLDTMTPEERGYALLEGHWDGSNSKYQQLHPMKRAETISQLVSQMQKELLGDHATAGKKGPRQTIMDLSPTEKAAARDVLVQYKAMEIFNGLVLTGEKGWQGRGYLPADKVLDELKTAVPEIHAEFTRRLEKAHVLPFEGVKSTWPRVKATLEGSELLRRVKDKDTIGLGALLAPEYSEAKFTR